MYTFKILIKFVLRFLTNTPTLISRIWVDFLSLIWSGFRTIYLEMSYRYLENVTTSIEHVKSNNETIHLNFYTPNAISLFRTKSFSSKEPETLTWIEQYGASNAILFDIGANVGLYSIYHSLVNQGKTIAFEPSFYNLKLLMKNININNCQNLISVVSNPLFKNDGQNDFRYSNPEEGGALSSFGVDFGYDGNKIDFNMLIKVIGFSLDSMFKLDLLNDIPNLVKIDVDGIEHLILSGAKATLTHPECKSILVEVNDAFNEQANSVQELLTSYGFVLKAKKHGQMFDDSSQFSSTFNQIWIKR